MEEKRCCIIHNYYVCPVCKTGYCKPFGEVKTRPIQKCRKCNKTVRMTIITQYDTQINTNTLQQDGFTEAATAEKLFYADRQTKTLEFVGRM